MKQNPFLCCAVFALFILALGGCVSVGKSPEIRFYTLRSLDESQAGKKSAAASGLIIGLHHLRIPEYQNRPQIVTQDKDGMLMFAQFDRWAESLDSALTRVIRENLRLMLEGANIEMYPWNTSLSVKYEVIVDIVGLESDLDKDMFFAVQWSVIDAKNKKVLFMKRSEFREPIKPHSYSGLVKTLGYSCASLSRDIAEALVSSAVKETQNGNR